MHQAAPKPDDFIHFSQISTYLKCRRKHDFAYIERLESRTFKPQMMFGTFGHAALADCWTTGGKADPSFDACVKKATEEHPEVAMQLTVDAVVAKQVATKAYEQLKQRFEPVMVEKSLIIQLGGASVGGTPDLVAKDEEGNLWVLDYKFRNSFMSPDSELLNLQMIFYQGLLAAHGYKTVGSRQVQIRPFLPKQPKMNKDCSMSKADCLTDWETYKKAVHDAGLDINDYRDMESKLADKRFVDFESCRALRSEQEISFFMRDEVSPAVNDIRLRTQFGMSSGPRRCFDQMSCGTCDFRELCVEEAKGGDLDFIKANQFRVKGTKDVVQTFELMEDE